MSTLGSFTIICSILHILSKDVEQNYRTHILKNSISNSVLPFYELTLHRQFSRVIINILKEKIHPDFNSFCGREKFFVLFVFICCPRYCSVSAKTIFSIVNEHRNKSSLLEVLCKKGVFKSFTKFTGK